MKLLNSSLCLTKGEKYQSPRHLTYFLICDNIKIQNKTPPLIRWERSVNSLKELVTRLILFVSYDLDIWDRPRNKKR